LTDGKKLFLERSFRIYPLLQFGSLIGSFHILDYKSQKQAGNQKCRTQVLRPFFEKIGSTAAAENIYGSTTQSGIQSAFGGLRQDYQNQCHANNDMQDQQYGV